MRLTVNGNGMDIPEEVLSVEALIARLGLSERRVAVEHNRIILPRDAFASTRVEDGDVLEILSFVGGG